MGVREVNRKFEMIELAAVTMVTTKTQRSVVGTFLGGRSLATQRAGRKGGIVQIY